MVDGDHRDGDKYNATATFVDAGRAHPVKLHKICSNKNFKNQFKFYTWCSAAYLESLDPNTTTLLLLPKQFTLYCRIVAQTINSNLLMPYAHSPGY